MPPPSGAIGGPRWSSRRMLQRPRQARARPQDPRSSARSAGRTCAARQQRCLAAAAHPSAQRLCTAHAASRSSARPRVKGTAARRLRPVRPPARLATSARASGRRPPASVSLGQLADVFWLSGHTGLGSDTEPHRPWLDPHRRDEPLRHRPLPHLLRLHAKGGRRRRRPHRCRRHRRVRRMPSGAPQWRSGSTTTTGSKSAVRA